MRWQDLIATSRLLTSTPDPNTAPLPDSLRRAVSTAYYAVFHALANSNADCLIGVPTSPLLEHTWQRARRGLDHTPARRNLEQDRHRFSPPVQEFITTFAALQNCGPLLLTLPRPAPNLVLSHPARWYTIPPPQLSTSSDYVRVMDQRLCQFGCCVKPNSYPVR